MTKSETLYPRSLRRLIRSFVGPTRRGGSPFHIPELFLLVEDLRSAHAFTV